MLRGSCAFNETSWILFFPSILTFNRHCSGSTSTFFSSSFSSSSSSSTNSASSSNLALAISSCFFLAAVAIALLLKSIHLSIASLATANGATLITFLPFPTINALFGLPSSLANPTLLRIETAGAYAPIFCAIILFSKLTRRYLTSNGSRMTFESNDRKTFAESSASAMSPLTCTNSSNLELVRTCNRSL